MKIVTYDEFIRMPAGTIFATYEPCVFKDRFQIKTDGGWEVGKNYYFNGAMPLEPWLDVDNMLSESLLGTYKTEMCTYDDSNADYSEDELFAILEPHEVKELIKALYWALDGCPGEFDEYNERYV